MSEKTFTIKDKFTGEEFMTIAKAEEKHVTMAVTEALNTFENDTLSPYDRYEILLRASELIKERKEDALVTLVKEVGKTIRDARGEVDRAIQTMMLSAEEAKRIGGEVLPISATPGAENRVGFTMRIPIGVIAAITPFNSPFNLACHKIGPSIAAGNTILWKPATSTSASAYLLMEILKDAGLPPGYVNLVCGSGSQMGEWLLKDKRIGKYAFTGSELNPE
jgi:acyl-CoA reductase-like NAD-dependent aldehyde dehydrogenase